MTVEKRGRPVAVCTICGRYEYQVQNINARCTAETGNKRCKGAASSALDLNDWQACGDCAASGRRDDADCPSCNGSGWHYLRPRIGILR